MLMNVHRRGQGRGGARESESARGGARVTVSETLARAEVLLTPTTYIDIHRGSAALPVLKH